ncbi:MAG: hypothetical protein A3H98_11620 [Bacteroidetes bacterium RIFCSPLOWO2_02_FULL_36_8]|nr:MAG: hypothetical protein A3H98_11620 [Bacteroidetes bacterium RIFCSPLOWO2_02_FULL_36_8]OFY69619.1 MAG: hypothetical protein A3G23_13875 [Bacteroidetes bacterium RIFCSPLOWO2_12_FULL_37_12]
MLFQDFRKTFYESGCFSIHQLLAWKPEFDNSTLTRWCHRGYIIKLRNGYYTFPEYLNVAGFSHFIANRIYKPSYVSIHHALSIYGLIPETVINITSVTSLKTATFTNKFGTFSYRTVKPDLLFGYTENPFMGGAIYIASLEKAILDLLYLYPFYNTKEELINLRFDENVLEKVLNTNYLYQYLEIYKSPVLEKKVKLLLTTYSLC